MTTALTRLSSTDLHGELFDHASLTRRGYDTTQVDGLVKRVRAELQRRDQEYDAVLAECAALRQENGSLWVRLGHLDANHQGQLISAQAVNMLSNAQRQAEAVYAETQDQCQQMTHDARGHCDGILAQARQQAQAILDEAHRTASAAGNMAATAYRAASTADEYEDKKEELERQVAYLQTFSHVWRDQMRAMLEALARQVEQWPPDGPPTPPSLGS